ncbi:S-4TM family putative pore-forming effector [Methylovulum psychrotolerans]|uniref:S-4TM family putative pore-forming effector n=1 Tax=Methylovulum psychrotolerans TaxID=1704499 RepID=UPI0018DF803E
MENLKSLREHLNSNWQGLLINNHTPDESYVISRRIQDEIYKNRKDNQLIYDFLYKKYKSEMEGAMCYSVNIMINEYNLSVST